jgi:hypothetical protein
MTIGKPGADEPEFVVINMLSRFVYVWILAYSANAENAAKALMKWFSLLSVVHTWVSDNPLPLPERVNRYTVSSLAFNLSADHWFTAANSYSPKGL